MKKILFLMTILNLFPQNVYPSPSEKGPFLTRNNYPPFLLFLQIPNDSALNISQGELYVESLVSHSNVFSGKKTSVGIVAFDMESTRFSNRLIYGLNESISFGLEIPFIYLWQGFLDTPTQMFHDVFGLPNQNRENGKDNSYWYIIDVGNDNIRNQGKNILSMGDITLSSSLEIIDEKTSWAEISLIGALKFPSGNTRFLHGSGKYDYGMGLAIKKSMNNIHIYSITGMVYPEKPDFLNDVKIQPFMTESLSFEYAYSPALSLIMQLDYNSNPFSSGISKLDEDSFELVTGFKKKFLNAYVCSISFTENLSAETTPDYTLQIGIGHKF